MHVAFIDDEFGSVEALSQYVTAQGASCSHYDWSDHGTRFFRERAADEDLVVMLDLYFSGEMQGPSILRSLRTWQPDVPVIVCTLTNDAETVLIAIREWEANDVFIKASRPVEEAWPLLQRCSSERRVEVARLQQALAKARGTDSQTQFEGFEECSRIVASTEHPHVSALRGKQGALIALLGAGAQQEQLPMIRLLHELRATCIDLSEAESSLDRETLKHWKLTCLHLEDGDGLRKLGARLLELRRASDPELRSFISWQLNRLGPIDSTSKACTLLGWVNEVPEPIRVAAHLKLCLGLGSPDIQAELSGLVAASWEQRVREEPDSIASLESQMIEQDERVVANLLLAGGGAGGSLVMDLVERRVETLQRGMSLGLALRTSHLIELLGAAKPLADGARLQAAAATLALLIYVEEGRAEASDRCLRVACSERVYDALAAERVLDMLAESDTQRLVAVFDSWMADALDGKPEVLAALVTWAAKNQAKLLDGPVDMQLLHRVVKSLVRGGRAQEGLELLFQTVDLGLKEMLLRSKGEREADLVLLKDMVEYGQQHAVGPAVQVFNRLEERVTAAVARGFRLAPLLEGWRVAVLAGENSPAGPELLPRCKAAVEEQLGAACETFSTADNAVEAMKRAISFGGFSLVAVLADCVSHAAREKIQDSCTAAAKNGISVRFTHVSGLTGRALVKGLCKELSLLDELQDSGG